MAGSHSCWGQPIPALPAAPSRTESCPPPQQITLQSSPAQPYQALCSTSRKKLRKTSKSGYEVLGAAFVSACFCSVRLHPLRSVAIKMTGLATRRVGTTACSDPQHALHLHPPDYCLGAGRDLEQKPRKMTKQQTTEENPTIPSMQTNDSAFSSRCEQLPRHLAS